MISNYTNLTIKQFLNCKRISDTVQDPIDRNVRLLAEITDRTVDEIESLPLGELKEQLKQLASIETIDSNQKLKLKFKIKGKRFEVVWKAQELTAAQYIDVTHFAKDSTQVIYNIHNMLAAISVERTWYGKRKKYDGAKHKEISELFYNHMTIEQAYPIMLFFCRFYEELASNILTYLSEEAKAVLQKVEADFGRSTA